MPKRKASFYGVRVGKQPGVYDNWDVCKVQVIGFPGSKYKGFQTRAEAENYVNDSIGGFQDRSILKPSLDQIQVKAKSDKSHGHHLPKPTFFKGIVEYGSFGEATLPDELANTFSKNSTVSKEHINPVAEALVKDPSQLYKLTNEDGQHFIVFDSLKNFDLYFDAVCRSSNHSKTQISQSTAKCHEFKTESCTTVLRQQSPGKIAPKDDGFFYFKDEDDLLESLRPYFNKAKQGTVLQTNSWVQSGIYQLEFDGACIGNPGRAGAGALIRCPHGSVAFKFTEFLGNATNNIAEYKALLLGLKAALSKGIRRIKAQGDSKLVCLQVVGRWKIENKNLIPLYDEIKSLTVLFESFSITHVRREYNAEADALSKEALKFGEGLREVAQPQPQCCLSCS